MLTDIQGSTRLWQEHRALMPEVIRRHDEILTDGIRAKGGRVLTERGEGDSFFAVFSRATDALHAARDIQIAIRAEPWSEGIEIRVRMAIDTGEASGDYRGPIANRSARIRQLAVGGQILISQSTHALVRDQLPADITLADLGLRQLRDVVSTEHVFEAVVAGLERRAAAQAAAGQSRLRRRRALMAGVPAIALITVGVAALVHFGGRMVPTQAVAQLKASPTPKAVPLADWKIITVAGNGTAGYSTGGPATGVEFNHPEGIAVDGKGNVFIADTGNNRVRELLPDGTVIDVVGGGNLLVASGEAGTQLRLRGPTGLSFDSSGNLYIADTGDNRIIRMDPQLEVFGVAGTVAAGAIPRNGLPVSAAPLDGPTGVADTGWMLSNNSDTTTVAILDAGNSDLTGTYEGFLMPILASNLGPYASWRPWSIGSHGLPSIAVQPGFRVFVSDSDANTVTRINGFLLPLGVGSYTPFAGSGTAGYAGDGGKGASAELRGPEGLAVDTTAGRLFIADTGNNVIRVVDLFDDSIATAAGTGQPGYGGNGSKATDAELDGPAAVAMDSKGDVFIADTGNSVIRELRPS